MSNWRLNPETVCRTDLGVQRLQNTAFGSILACVSQRLRFPQKARKSKEGIPCFYGAKCPFRVPKKCTVSGLKRQFDKWRLFHAYPEGEGYLPKKQGKVERKQKGGFGECALVPGFCAVVPFFVPSFQFLASRNTGFCALVPFLVLSKNIRQNKLFGNHLVLRPPEKDEQSRAAKRGRFQTGGFPDLDLSFLFCPFLSFLGLSRFFRDFPDLLWDGSGFSRFVPFLFLGLLRAPTRNSPERVRDTIWTFPEKKWETPRFGNLPV